MLIPSSYVNKFQPKGFSLWLGFSKASRWLRSSCPIETQWDLCSSVTWVLCKIGNRVCYWLGNSQLHLSRKIAFLQTSTPLLRSSIEPLTVSCLYAVQLVRTLSGNKTCQSVTYLSFATGTYTLKLTLFRNSVALHRYQGAFYGAFCYLIALVHCTHEFLDAD